MDFQAFWWVKDTDFQLAIVKAERKGVCKPELLHRGVQLFFCFIFIFAFVTYCFLKSSSAFHDKYLDLAYVCIGEPLNRSLIYSRLTCHYKLFSSALMNFLIAQHKHVCIKAANKRLFRFFETIYKSTPLITMSYLQNTINMINEHISTNCGHNWLTVRTY